MKRIAVIVGTRPDAIKLAPVVAALRSSTQLQPYVIASGQHRELLEQARDTVGLRFDATLDVMEQDQTLASLAGRLLPAIDAALADCEPEFVVVQGDTATMLSGALAAFYRQLPIGHVEAGLRSGDLGAPFPEEANRRLVTPLASLHFAPTAVARDRLLAEGVAPDAVLLTGNTIVDALRAEESRQHDEAVGRALEEGLADAIGGGAGRSIVLITVHRRESIGPALAGILDAIADLAAGFPEHLFCLPVHLNPRVRGAVHDRLGGLANVRLLEPLGYDAFVFLLRRCRLALTDSGGVQEEAPVFGKPVVVMRSTTERPEGIEAGVAVLAGVEPAAIVATASRLLTDERAYSAMARATSPYGDGRAAGRIVDAIERFLAARA